MPGRPQVVVGTAISHAQPPAIRATVTVARIAVGTRPVHKPRNTGAFLGGSGGAAGSQLLAAVWIALIAEVTLTADAVPVPDTEL
jgi:hypothetical protein